MTTTAATETRPAAIPTSSRLGLIDFFRSDDNETPGLVSIAAAGLLIAVAIIHLQDQGGLLGGESPIWLKYGYYLVELLQSAGRRLGAAEENLGLGPWSGIRRVSLPRLSAVALSRHSR